MRPIAWGRQHGQSLAEFALVVPIFLLLVLALFDIGRYVVAQNALTNAAREGARLAVVNQHQPSIEERVRKLAFITTPTIQTPVYLLTTPAVNDVNLDDNARCGPDGAISLSVGCVALIRVSADLTPITPIVSALIPPVTLQATAMQPVEFVCPNLAITEFATFDKCPKKP